MALSGLPTGGPAIPAGATRVSIKNIDTASNQSKEDVTDLSHSERTYEDPPLVDGGSGAATKTCSATGFLYPSTSLGVTPIETTTGWICEDIEKVYEVGKFVTWSANWSYYEA
jgi:hypothetical protein